MISTPARTRSAQPVAPRDEQIDASRRSFVTLAAAAVPAVATGSGLYGLTSSQSPVVLPNIPMIFDNLPPELEGLRIMQITDLHLGYYITLDTLAEMLLTAAPHRPDLVLITGDVSDDLSVLPEALRMIDALKPRFGTFASLGNHEYYRGIEEVRRIYDRSPIPLLVEEGVAIPVRGAELFIGGGDDPARKDEAEMNKEAFFKQTVEHTFRESSERAFRLLMSHRPEGFDPAADLGIPMTIAGHTHAGGQLGWRGRGLFEAWFDMGKYLWGHYEKNDGRSRLYTSAGCGHWFPFRLGVPREVPVYVLRRTPDADRFA